MRKRAEKHSTPWMALCLAALLALTLVPAALAETPQESQEKAEQELTPVNFNGVKIFIDPQTGRMRPPTAEEVQELAAVMRTQFAAKSAPELIQHANGMESVVMGQDHLNFMMIHKHDDGTVSLDCTTGVEPAIEVIKAAAAQATAQPQREEQ